MAEKLRFPQIPSTVWWGVRSIIQRTPAVTKDERLLGVQLGVQEGAARAYLTELRAVGILTDDGKATSLAQKWRLDESYADAVDEIIRNTYPEGLIHVAPPGDAERQKITSWFLRAGLGQGSAGNKAATYLLISSRTPIEAPRSSPKTTQEDNGPRSRSKARAQPSSSSKKEKAIPEKPPVSSSAEGRGDTSRGGPDPFPLNVNVQIHISADAGTEQIESIFKAMRRYLYDTSNT